MNSEALAARMEAEHYDRVRERELSAETCKCGVVSRGLVDGKCADCREKEQPLHVHAQHVKCHTSCPAYAEPAINVVTLHLCDLCLDGQGGTCNVPACALCRSRAPNIFLRDSPMVTRIVSLDQSA